VASRVLGNGLKTTYSYDDANRVTKVAHAPNGGGAAVMEYRYGYDNVYNRRFEREVHRAGSPSEVYVYDG
jgi:hypothetical protein